MEKETYSALWEAFEAVSNGAPRLLFAVFRGEVADLGALSGTQES
jgi:hypothetical protein